MLAIPEFVEQTSKIVILSNYHKHEMSISVVSPEDNGASATKHFSILRFLYMGTAHLEAAHRRRSKENSDPTIAIDWNDLKKSMFHRMAINDVELRVREVNPCLYSAHGACPHYGNFLRSAISGTSDIVRSSWLRPEAAFDGALLHHLVFVSRILAKMDSANSVHWGAERELNYHGCTELKSLLQKPTVFSTERRDFTCWLDAN